MIPFFQKTWFVWWTLATVVILRWFHLFSSHSHERFLEDAAAKEEEASKVAKQIPSGAASRLFG